jgi:hypothetical protein
VATTNERGEFVIDDVPAGSYPITMWHEGVHLKQILPTLQRFEYEDPYEVTEQVVVSPGQDATVNFRFELRPSPPH